MVVLQRIKSIISYFYYEYFSSPMLVRKGGKKKALISYIKRPFKSHSTLTHCNVIEAIVVADVLHNLGWEVCVADYRARKELQLSTFSLVIGFGFPFAQSFADTSFTGKRIMYLPGANPNYSNAAEAARAKQLCERTGVLLKPRREAYSPWMFGAINADAIFVLGNEWTVSTYSSEINKNIFKIPVPFIGNFSDHEYDSRDWKSVGNRFVWFAGSGALHKGLDLVLDAIALSKNSFHLDVCGPISNEKDFIDLYSHMLFRQNNIKFHGFVDVASEAMHRVMEQSAFVVFPSCSEGGGSSVLTCMAAGLIPIVTRESSIYVGDFGITIENVTPEGVLSALMLAAELPIEEKIRRSQEARSYVFNQHSIEIFKTVFSRAISEVCHGYYRTQQN